LLTSEEDENDDNSIIHKMLVCIVCDQCIIGKDKSKLCTLYQQCPAWELEAIACCSGEL